MAVEGGCLSGDTECKFLAHSSSDLQGWSSPGPLLPDAVVGVQVHQSQQYFIVLR